MLSVLKQQEYTHINIKYIHETFDCISIRADDTSTFASVLSASDVCDLLNFHECSQCRNTAACFRVLWILWIIYCGFVQGDAHSVAAAPSARLHAVVLFDSGVF